MTHFVAIDVQTTGVHPDADDICELAVVPVGPGETWSSVIRAQRGRSPSAQNAAAPRFGDLAAAFLGRICGDGVVVVSHNVGFDLGFIRQATRDCGAKVPAMVAVSTRDAALLLLGAEGRLDELCERYDVPLLEGHTAVGDAASTAGLFAHLLAVADEHGIGTDWLPLVHHRGPPLDLCGLPAVAASPLARDLDVWPPAPRRSRSTERLEVLISAETLFPGHSEADLARESLRELLADPERSTSSRAQIEELLQLDDDGLLAELERLLAEHEPTEADLLRERVSEALCGGGLVQLHLLEALRDEVRGTEFETQVVRQLFDTRIDVLDLDGQVATVVEFLHEPHADIDFVGASTGWLLAAAVEDGRLDLADRLVSAHPPVLQSRNSSGTMDQQLRALCHRLMSSDQLETAVRVADWARHLPYDDATSTELRAVYGHILERSGDTAGALAALSTDWEGGVRSALHADRLSLLASRSGDKVTARRVLAAALDELALTDEQRTTLGKRLTRLS